MRSLIINAFNPHPQHLTRGRRLQSANIDPVTSAAGGPWWRHVCRRPTRSCRTSARLRPPADSIAATSGVARARTSPGESTEINGRFSVGDRTLFTELLSHKSWLYCEDIKTWQLALAVGMILVFENVAYGCYINFCGELGAQSAIAVD